jgi:hypothetical protein
MANATSEQLPKSEKPAEELVEKLVGGHGGGAAAALPPIQNNGY